MNNRPEHIAIIMDGNGRWAKERGLPRVAGHRAGVKTVNEIVQASLDLEVPYLTLYAFSQENWKRPKEEISVLMDLLDFFINREIRNLIRLGVSLKAIGHIEALPTQTLAKLKEAMSLTAGNKQLLLTVALNYGARREILDAVGAIVRQAKASPSNFDESSLTEETFASYLNTRDLPDPDLLIRTSGEMRLSNFLLWQLSYSEIYITKKYWPDFTREDYMKAIREYQKRERRFGNVQQTALASR